MTVYELELVAEQSDQSSAIIQDVSVYDGEARVDKANFLVVSKNDKNGTPTYLVVANALPLSQVEWTFPTVLDGWYRFNLLRLTLYSSPPVNTLAEVVDGNGVITQYATILYHTTTSQVVKAKTTGSISVQPGETGWETYWEVISDLPVLVNYGVIQVHVHSDKIDVRLRDKYRDYLEVVRDKFIIGEKASGPEYEKTELLKLMLNGLEALTQVERFAEMESTVRIMEEIFD